MKQRNKRLITVVISIILAIGIVGGVSSAYAGSATKSYTLKTSAISKSYTVNLNGSITKTKLRASTYYEGTAKILSVSGVAIRTDKASGSQMYLYDDDSATLNNVTKKTASVSFTASSGHSYQSAQTGHYVKTGYSYVNETLDIAV